MMARRAAAAAAIFCAAASAHTWWNLTRLRRPVPRPTPERISVLLPARDEADRIQPCVEALARLEGVHEVIVLDDNSTDGTAEVARRHLPRVMRSTQEPPAGWLGKPYACQRLAEAADGDLLLFVDADVVLHPLAAIACAGLLDRVDAVCPYPRQLTSGPLARLVQPLLQWSWLTFLPLDLAERSSHPMLAAGNGQLLAVRREAYFGAGGHAAVRDRVLEDLELMRALKRAGFTTGMADGTHLAECRMYDTDAELIAGYGKSLHAAFGPGTVALLAAAYVAPAVAVATARDPLTRGWAAAALVAAVGGRAAVAARTGGRPLDSIAHPVSVACALAIYAYSVVGARRGTLRWRGRPV